MEHIQQRQGKRPSLHTVLLFMHNAEEATRVFP